MLQGNTMSLRWAKPNSVQSFKLKIDKCTSEDCYTVLDKKTSETSFSITDTIYSQCTIYDVRLDGLNAHQSTVLSAEVMLKKSFSECYASRDIIIGVGFTILALLLIGEIPSTNPEGVSLRGRGGRIEEPPALQAGVRET